MIRRMSWVEQEDALSKICVLLVVNRPVLPDYVEVIDRDWFSLMYTVTISGCI